MKIENEINLSKFWIRYVTRIVPSENYFIKKCSYQNALLPLELPWNFASFVPYYIPPHCAWGRAINLLKTHPRTRYAVAHQGQPTNKIGSHCNTLQHTATHCNTLHHTASHCITLHHTASHCNTPHHTETHCNTLQHTATHGMTVLNSRLSAVVSRIHIAGYYTFTHSRTQTCIHRRNRMDVLEGYFSWTFHLWCMTHLHMWCMTHFFGCIAWLIFICGAWLNFLFLCETNRIPSNEADSDTVNDSSMTLTSIIYICGTTHSCVWHGIGTRKIHSYSGHDSFWCRALRVEFLLVWFEFSRLPHTWATDRTHNPLDDHFNDNDRK